MFDVFYIGPKPGLFVHEKPVQTLEQAQCQSRTRYCWVVTYLANYSDWDWLWEPPPWQSQYTHVWPSQHHEFSGTYLVPQTGDIEYHFHQHIVPLRHRPVDFTIKRDNVEFDYSWAPHPMDPPYIYVFGNQWWPAEVMPTVEYHVPGATQRKYMAEPRAQLTQRHSNVWHTLQNCQWDYSWCPNPGDPPYIYVFGNQWWPAEVMPTVEYHVPGATQRKYMAEPKAKLIADRSNWKIPDSIDASHFDFSWCPNPGAPPMNYQFGTQHQRTGGPQYVMPNATVIHYQAAPRASKITVDPCWEIPQGIDTDLFDWTWHPDDTEPDYIYQFGTQWQRTGGPRYHMPGATKIHYQVAPRATKVSVDPCWQIPHGVDTDSFDWTWHPDDTEPDYIYQFGTQHQRTGGPQYIMPDAVEIKYVDQIRVDTVTVVPIVEIDHLDGNVGKIPNVTKTVRYFDNYRDTLIRIANSLDCEWAWICSSVCDYTDFDFTWHPNQWQSSMLHVFASNEQKFGDTFFMHVPTFRAGAKNKQLLEWYDVNFVQQPVPRRPMPHVIHNADTHVEIIKTQETFAPLVLYSNRTVAQDQIPTVPLWREQTKTIVPLDSAASAIVVPQAAKSYIKTQLYDYPHIDKTYKNTLAAWPQDIVFISYDEPEADANWQKLIDRFPRAQRVHGVKGMENALAEAAGVSKTPWYFAVFGKTVLAPTFDFSFQPDYMQPPKHYIFYSENRANKLVYGEMAIILYNRRLILDNHGKEFGLDYTMSFPHEVVPILSTYGNFDTSPYHAWRTAFRETAKLAYFESQQSTVEGRYRLHTWLNKAEGDFAEWVLRGAADGHAFFEQSQGDLAVLKQSFSWQWLQNRFETAYGSLK